jgi:DNA-binding transcriptional regulator PaaX
MVKNSLSKIILEKILTAKTIRTTKSLPYFAFCPSRDLWKPSKERTKAKNRAALFKNAFYYLKRKGYLEIVKKNHQIYITLTKEGEKKAKKYQIDDLEIKKPKTWDRKYRIIVFDIPNVTRIKRDALRGKLKELGFYRLQQSVWVYPYECKKEIDLLREFFGLTPKELILISGKMEGDKFLRKFFNLK